MKNFSKQLLAIVSTTFVVSAVNAADTDGSYYVKGQAGIAMPSKIGDQKFDNSAIFGIEGGYKVNDKFRFGLGLGMLNNAKFNNDSNRKASSLFGEINAYYDIADLNGFTPYITAGFGYAKNKLKISSQGGSTPGGAATQARFSTPTILNQQTATVTLPDGTYSTSTPTVDPFTDSSSTSASSSSTSGAGSSSSGSGSSSSSTSSESLSKSGFAWNVGVGGMININQEWTIDVAYRYRDFGKLKISQNDSKKLKSHNVTVGVMYKF